MNYITQTNIDFDIPVIGQGGMGIGGRFSRDETHDQEHVDALRYGIDCGMTLIDTAEVYAEGHSEELVGKAVQGVRDKIFLTTKTSPENLRFDDVLIAAEGSLRRLGADHIDLYQIHWPNPSIRIDETIRAMEQLVRQGKIRYIGVSNFSLHQLKQAQSALTSNMLVSQQQEYNLFDRSVEDEILPYCQKQDILFIAYSPLDQGIKWSPKKADLLQKFAEKYDKTINQIALNWLIRHDNVVAIPKSVNRSHIMENAMAGDFQLAENEYQEISRVCKNQVEHVPVEQINPAPVRVAGDGVYCTVQEAMENRKDFCPGPAELAETIKDDDWIKPVRVVLAEESLNGYRYVLTEGRIRFWAWVIAFEGKRPVPVYIRD